MNMNQKLRKFDHSFSRMPGYHRKGIKALKDAANKMSMAELIMTYLSAHYNNLSACDELYTIWEAVEARGYMNGLKENKNEMVMRAISNLPIVDEPREKHFV